MTEVGEVRDALLAISAVQPSFFELTLVRRDSPSDGSHTIEITVYEFADDVRDEDECPKFLLRVLDEDFNGDRNENWRHEARGDDLAVLLDDCEREYAAWRARLVELFRHDAHDEEG